MKKYVINDIKIVPIILNNKTFITFFDSVGDIFTSSINPIISIAKKLFPAPIVEAIETIGDGICN